MTDDLFKIVSPRAIARRAYRTTQENLFVGVGVVHVLGITAALRGWIGPIQAARLHLGPDILSVFKLGEISVGADGGFESMIRKEKH